MENEKDIQRIELELKTRLGRSKKPKLPEGYFEAFPDRLMQKIKEEPKRGFVLNTWLLPLTAAAALALLVVFSQNTDAPQEDALAAAEAYEPLILPEMNLVEEQTVVPDDVRVQEEEVLPEMELDMLEEALADSYVSEQKDEFDQAMEELSQEEIEEYLSTTIYYSEL